MVDKNKKAKGNDGANRFRLSAQEIELLMQYRHGGINDSDIVPAWLMQMEDGKDEIPDEIIITGKLQFCVMFIWDSMTLMQSLLALCILQKKSLTTSF